MIPLKFGITDYSLKSKFSELTKKEFLMVAWIRSKRMDQEGMSQDDFNALRIMLFRALSNVPQRLIENISNVQWVDILPHLNWCFNAPDFTSNPLPELRKGFKTFVGPVGMLDHSNISEMVQADTAFISAANGKDPDKLYLLASILYRPVRSDLRKFKKSPKWNGDIREPFNMNNCKARVEIFKRIPVHNITAVFLYYWSFRETKLMSFKRVFPNKPVETTGTNRGWAGSLLEMAHLPVFGDFDKVSEQHWFTVIFEMDRQMEQAEKREAEAERARLNHKIANR